MGDTQPTSEKKLTLLLLCWLFGLLGVHRFYTGKYLSGGLQLLALGLATLCGFYKAQIPGTATIVIILLWLIIDIMQIIMGKFTDIEGKPITDWL